MVWNNDMSKAPKDRPILVEYNHDADPYYIEHEKSLTDYGYHAELACYKGIGYCVAEWADSNDVDESGEGWGPWTHNPGWWFDANSDGGIAVNPVKWMEIPDAGI